MDKRIKKITSETIIYAMEDPSSPETTEWFEKETHLSSEKEYDENNNLVKSISYNHSGDINEHILYKFDEKNNCIEEICFFDENEIAEHHYFVFDDKNLCANEKIVYAESGESHVTFKYDERGNLLERRVMNPEGETEEMEVFEYDGDKLISEKLFGEDNVLEHENKYSYHENGDVVLYEHITSEERSSYTTEYFYNQKGEREKILIYDAQGRLREKLIYTRDDKGNILEVTEEDVTSVKTTKMSYDEKNNPVKQEDYNKEGILILSIERTFNDDGVLTETTVFSCNPVEEIYQLNATRHEYLFYDETHYD
ncbi:MAG: hypothetical protein M0R16_13250 [Bacteroidales bacterium]|jgi:hypothetical protein|nr:hypothetical protein [Bacteroidales bacterium]